MKQVFTTGEVAKICKVAPRTVSQWFDAGRLRGYRIPGSQDRRIPRENLVQFLREHDMPMNGLDVTGSRILLIGLEPLLVGRLHDLFPEDQGYRVELAHSGFEAGIQAEKFYPDAIVIDLALGRGEAMNIVQLLRKNSQYQRTLIIALANEDETGDLTACGFSEVFKKPFDVTLLAERVRNLSVRE